MKLMLNFCFTVIILNLGHAQDLGAYTDYRDRFYIFDQGAGIKIEDQAPQSFKIGGEYVLYINSQGNLKSYHQGRVIKLEAGGVTDYYATDHIAAYTVFEKLRVIENGTAVTLSTRCPFFRVEDSLIVYYDKNTEAMRVYYRGGSVGLESGMMGMPVENLSTGDNIVAYISSRTKDFKIYYRGENHTILQAVEGLRFKAGKDIVAFRNTLDNSFNVFYKGEIYRLEEFYPEAYKMGDGFVAYTDNFGTFKVFYEGVVREVSSFAPQTFYAEDNLLLFTEYDYFKVFYGGEVYELEAYLPRYFKLDWNSVAYLDNSNRMWLFSKGEKKYFSNELINSFEIYRDLIIMNVKVDRNVICYKGKFIDGLAY
jgi:hypothetical protein